MPSQHSRPTRATPAGRAYLDLQNRARREGRATGVLLTLYVLERFLWRLSLSRHAGSFILKGGLLLAALGARRTTADGDLLARGMRNDESEVTTCITEICGLEDGHAGGRDGVRFDTSTVRTQTIREASDYAGVRIRMDAYVGSARPLLRLDVNFGDPITPGARRIAYQQLRGEGESFDLLTYPVETVLAEKLCTAIVLGDANTRIRDYVDVWRLIGRHDLEAAAVQAALAATAAFRGVALRPLSSIVEALGHRRQGDYQVFRRNQGPDTTDLPERFDEVVAAVLSFVDSITTTPASVRQWTAASRRWT